MGNIEVYDVGLLYYVAVKWLKVHIVVSYWVY